ncbi:MAG: hypothetical protein ACKOEZ_06585, partial [Spartobacteria bacterium]
ESVRGIVSHAPHDRREAASLLDALAALPRKWSSDGLRLVAYASESAPTLPRVAPNGAHRYAATEPARQRAS